MSLLLATVGLLFTLHAPASETEVAKIQNLKVVRISDGDTIALQPQSGTKPLKIRMLSIDSAELHLPGNGKMNSQGKWAEDADAFLKKLIPVGTKVELHSYGTDQYGRVLGRIFHKGRDINLEMVRSGHAIPYFICTGRDCNSTYMKRHDVEEYIEACRTAQRTGKAIFNPKDPLKEMPFEFRLRIQKRKPDKYVGDFEDGTFHEPADYSEVEVCQRIFFMKKDDAEKIGYRPAR